MVTSERETESYALSVDITRDDTPTTFKLKVFGILLPTPAIL